VIVGSLDGNSQNPRQAKIMSKMGGKEKTVLMVSDLRPAATPRAVKFLPGQGRNVNIHEEEFAIFENGTSVTMGIVMEVVDAYGKELECQVHEHSCNVSGSVWLPLWRGPPPMNKLERKGRPPATNFLPDWRRHSTCRWKK
jgi:hypothetical protein